MTGHDPQNAGRARRPRRVLLASAAGWIAVAAIFALLCYRTPLRALQSAVATADPVLLGAATAIGLLAEIVVSSAKLRRLLALLGTEMSLWETTVLRMGAYPVRQLLPLKSGELFRMSYLRRRHGMSFGRAAILAILDAGTDALALGVFAAVGLVLREWAHAPALGLAALALITALIITSPAWRPRLAAWVRRRLGDPPGRDAGTGAPGRAPTRLAHHAAAAAAWTVLLVLLELVDYALVFRAFHLDVPLSALVLFVPIVVFAAGLPATPMGLGVREAAITFLLAPYGSPAELLAAAVASSAVVKLVPTLAGIAFVRPLLRRMLAPRAASPR